MANQAIAGVRFQQALTPDKPFYYGIVSDVGSQLPQ
jgi:hypothetical protein